VRRKEGRKEGEREGRGRVGESNQQKQFTKNNYFKARYLWLMPVILATQEDCCLRSAWAK
jgi:hypothetical protein